VRLHLSSIRVSDTYGAVFRTAAAICAVMPAGLAAGLAWCGGQIEWACRPAKRRRLAENLAHATSRRPEDPYVRRLVHRNVTTGARRAAGLLWAFARPEAAAARIEITPRDRFDRLLADSRGIVLSSAHFGPFEAAAAASRTLPVGAGLAVVTDENAVGRGMHTIRERLGMTIVPADRSPRPLLRILARGGVVVVLGDLHRPGMRGHQVRFLDTSCILPGGPAAIARMSQAPIVPFAVYPDGPRRWRMELGTPITPPDRHGGDADERRATQELADAFTGVIRAMPQQWDAVDPIPWQDRSPE
jgi:lauroyl/myristoyl acyltransferase